IDGSATPGLFTGISSNSLGTTGDTGHAGDLNINVDGTLRIIRGKIAADTFSSGNGGAVILRANSILIQDFGIVSSDAFFNGSGSGNGGSVTLTGDSIVIRLSFVETSSPAGKGGAVTLTATNSLEIDGSRVSSDTNGGFEGGDVRLTANAILIQGSGTPA